jgi:hypothetical protein
LREARPLAATFFFGLDFRAGAFVAFTDPAVDFFAFTGVGVDDFAVDFPAAGVTADLFVLDRPVVLTGGDAVAGAACSRLPPSARVNSTLHFGHLM